MRPSTELKCRNIPAQPVFCTCGCHKNLVDIGIVHCFISHELDKVDKLIYESQNEYFIEIVSDYFVDSKDLKNDHLHYNKILGDESVNISFITLKKIIDTYCTDTSEDIFMIMNQILDPEFIKFYDEKKITELLDYAISEHYNSASLEYNPFVSFQNDW